MAWPSSSRTSTPAPSPSTNPQRSSSNGLEALLGSSLYLALRAFILHAHWLCPQLLLLQGHPIINNRCALLHLRGDRQELSLSRNAREIVMRL